MDDDTYSMAEDESETSSLKLATASSSDGNDEVDEDDSEDDMPVFKPPDRRELPARATRGKRLTGILESEHDRLFWGHDTWEEEDNDDEWQTDDERHYKDKFDSDFLSSESANEESETKQGEMYDRELKREELRAKKKFDYEKIAKRRKLRKDKAQRIWSVLELEKIMAATEPNTRKGRKGSRFLTQADHLRIAQQTEEINKQILTQINDEIETRKFKRGTQNTESIKLAGELSAWVSWSSDRKIDYEESKKSAAQKLKESLEPIRERQLQFFMNLGNPSACQIPEMYRQSPPMPAERRCSIFPELPAKYQDPVTKEFYSNAEAFNRLRESHLRSDLIRVSKVLARTLAPANQEVHCSG